MDGLKINITAANESISCWSLSPPVLLANKTSSAHAVIVGTGDLVDVQVSVRRGSTIVASLSVTLESRSQNIRVRIPPQSPGVLSFSVSLPGSASSLARFPLLVLNNAASAEVQDLYDRQVKYTKGSSLPVGTGTGPHRNELHGESSSQSAAQLPEQQYDSSSWLSLESEQKLLAQSWEECLLPIVADFAAICDPDTWCDKEDDISAAASTPAAASTSAAAASSSFCTVDSRVQRCIYQLVPLLCANSMYDTLKALRDFASSNLRTMLKVVAEQSLPLPFQDCVCYQVLHQVISHAHSRSLGMDLPWHIKAASMPADLLSPMEGPSNSNAQEEDDRTVVMQQYLAQVQQYGITTDGSTLGDTTRTSSSPDPSSATSSMPPATLFMSTLHSLRNRGSTIVNVLAGYSDPGREEQFGQYWNSASSTLDGAALAIGILLFFFLVFLDAQQGFTKALLSAALLGAPLTLSNGAMYLYPRLVPQHRDMLVVLARSATGITLITLGLVLQPLPHHTNRLIRPFFLRLLTWGIVNPTTRPVLCRRSYLVSAWELLTMALLLPSEIPLSLKLLQQLLVWLLSMVVAFVLDWRVRQQFEHGSMAQSDWEHRLRLAIWTSLAGFPSELEQQYVLYRNKANLQADRITIILYNLLFILHISKLTNRLYGGALVISILYVVRICGRLWILQVQSVGERLRETVVMVNDVSVSLGLVLQCLAGTCLPAPIIRIYQDYFLDCILMGLVWPLLRLVRPRYHLLGLLSDLTCTCVIYYPLPPEGVRTVYRFIFIAICSTVIAMMIDMRARQAFRRNSGASGEGGGSGDAGGVHQVGSADRS